MSEKSNVAAAEDGDTAVLVDERGGESRPMDTSGYSLVTPPSGAHKCDAAVTRRVYGNSGTRSQSTGTSRYSPLQANGSAMPRSFSSPPLPTLR